MIRDVMLAMTHTAHDEAALRASVELARVHSAHLSIVLPLDIPIAAATNSVSTLVRDSSFAELRGEMKATADKLDNRMRSEGISYEVRVAEGVIYAAETQLAVQARYSDLVVVAAPRDADRGIGGDDGILRGIFASLLLHSGRPVLVVPEQWEPVFPFSTATIGWTPTAESARAVNDAMALLVTAQRVNVAVIEPLVGERQHGDDPGADIARHLTRHGLNVEVDVRHAKRGSVASELLLQVVEKRSQLLVVGGFGHARAREWAFGGATHELLSTTHVPILFAH